MAVSPRRALGVGAAGLTAVLAAAPLAHAAPSPTPGPSTGAKGSAAAPRPADSTSTSTSPRATTTAPVAPDYGLQKYRVGVQVKDGAYVPDGTSTVGTKLTVTDSGPAVQEAFGHDVTFSCTTDASTVVAGSTASYCLYDDSDYPVESRAARPFSRFRPLLHTQPTPSDGVIDELPQFFPGAPGDTITITQTGHRPNLAVDPATARLAPCVVDPDAAESGACTPADGLLLKATDVVFDDPGVPPTATDNSARTAQGTAVSIVVTKDDDTHGAPVTGLAVATDPKHGSATVVSGSGAPVGPTPTAPASSSAATTSGAPAAARAAVATGGHRAAAARPAAATVGTTIRYTPRAGFSGTDTFTYRLSDPNGSATARVTVTVVAAATPSASASSSGALADTGAHSSQLGELALILLVSGGVVTLLGRRRYVARHGRTD